MKLMMVTMMITLMSLLHTNEQRVEMVHNTETTSFVVSCFASLVAKKKKKKKNYPHLKKIDISYLIPLSLSRLISISPRCSLHFYPSSKSIKGPFITQDARCRAVTQGIMHRLRNVGGWWGWISGTDWGASFLWLILCWWSVEMHSAGLAPGVTHGVHVQSGKKTKKITTGQ